MARIGIDARFYSTSFTGIGRYTAELISHFAKMKTNHEFVIFLNPDEFGKFKLPAKNFKKVKVNARHYSLAEQTGLLTALNRENLDLVHFTHFNAPLLYGGRSIVTIHDLTLHRFPGKKMTSKLRRLAYHLVVRRAVGHATKVIAVSRNTAKDIRELLGTDSKKIETIYEGVGPEFRPAKNRGAALKSLQKKYQFAGDFVLYSGVWRNHKNLLGLVEAFGQLVRNKKTAAANLIVTGRPDPIYAPEIFWRVKELGLENKVKFVGLVPEQDLIALYQAARVYAFPSFYEGFGLPPLEAMACGTVVAASRVSCMPEIIGKENAVFFDPNKPADMAAKIGEAWANQPLRKKLEKRGLARAGEFDWADAAAATLQTYEAALAS